ncbi:MAG TPA: HD domain-containing protein [Candidatus Binatia bacterium]|nr:HD domain-containing protein [Candidatus Binatia bacterium]
MGLTYRLRQFWQLLAAQPLPADAWFEIEATLNAGELDLFRRLAPADRAHSFRVLHTLQEAGDTDPQLLAAALLHDVGKCHLPPTLWDRVAGAIGEHLLPTKARAWGLGSPSRWRRPFVIREQHAAWGAEMARLAGSHPVTVRLIRHHQDPLPAVSDAQTRDLLQRLQWADGQS